MQTSLIQPPIDPAANTSKRHCRGLQPAPAQGNTPGKQAVKLHQRLNPVNREEQRSSHDNTRTPTRVHQSRRSLINHHPSADQPSESGGHSNSKMNTRSQQCLPPFAPKRSQHQQNHSSLIGQMEHQSMPFLRKDKLHMNNKMQPNNSAMIKTPLSPKAIAMQYNLGGGKQGSPGSGQNLSQNEQCKLGKQRNLKHQLKHNLVALDAE